jgi:hypothetical protein
MAKREMSMVRKAELCEMSRGVATLDGHPAYVFGYGLEFARVYDTETGASYEWAWETVERVLLKGGAFKS